MSLEEEIATLRLLVDKHMDNENYYLASRYIDLIETLQREDKDDGMEAPVPCCNY